MIRLLVTLLVLLPAVAMGYGTPDYLPDAAHPRVWLTGEVVSDLKAKEAGNTAEWVALIERCNLFKNTYPVSGVTGALNWPGGGGYAGSGYYEAIASLGVAYHGLKGPDYGTGSATADDITAASYAAYAKALIDKMLIVFSAGVEQDGIELIRLHDHMYSFNKDEAAVLGTPARSFKDGYAGRSTGLVLPLYYDWFYDEISTEDKAVYYKAMYRHIDWYRNTRSTYNNGILLGDIRYHEDNLGPCSESGVWNTPNAGTPPDNCNINSTREDQAYKWEGYSNGAIGTNYYSGFAEMAMIAPLVVYGDAPQADADNYLAYAKQLWTDHYNSMTSDVGFKGGDSPEGLFYFSGWNFVLGGGLAIKTATGLDTFATFEFPKEMARNVVHNTFSSLDTMIHRGSWSGNITDGWMAPSAFPLNVTSHILREYYPTADEGKLLQKYLTTAPLYSEGPAWEQALFRDPTAATVEITTEPLHYRSIGTGTVTSRSSWDAAATATVLCQINLEGMFRVDHESQDNGAIMISRGPDRLLSRLKNLSIIDDETAQGQNSIVFNDGATYDQYQSRISGVTDPMQNPELTVPVIDRYDTEDEYLYVSGDVANGWEWGSNYPANMGSGWVKMFRRSLLHIQPNLFVVSDVTRSNTDVGTDKSWYMHFEGLPTVVGRTLAATVGASKIFVKGLYPAGGTYTTDDRSAEAHPSFGSAFFETKYEPATTQEYDQFLHVIEATDSAQSDITETVGIDTTGGTMRGAHIKAATNAVALFTTDQTGAAPSGTIEYTYTPTATTNNYITDLTPATTYSITVTGTTDKTVTLDPAGVTHQTSDGGMLAFSVADVGNAIALLNTPGEGEPPAQARVRSRGGVAAGGVFR